LNPADPSFDRAASKRPYPHFILCGPDYLRHSVFKKTCLGRRHTSIPAAGDVARSAELGRRSDQALLWALSYRPFQALVISISSGYSDMAIENPPYVRQSFLPPLLQFRLYKSTSINRFLAART